MALTYFTVTGTYEALITDAEDVGGEPDTQGISALVQFTPNYPEIHSVPESKVIRIAPILGRLGEDGVLRTIHGDTGVRLLANSAALGPLADPPLIYRVDFSHQKYDGGKGEKLTQLHITAPATDVTIDLSTVTE